VGLDKKGDPNTKERARTFALDRIGQVAGKRENRRIMGQYLMTENDIHENTAFYDKVAFGGWFIDFHTLGGLLAEMSETQAAGVAAAIAVLSGSALHDITLDRKRVRQVQQRLLREGCFSLNGKNEDSGDLARHARPSASSSATFCGSDPESTRFHAGIDESCTDFADADRPLDTNCV
jgi:hypothetical protein